MAEMLSQTVTATRPISVRTALINGPDRPTQPLHRELDVLIAARASFRRPLDCARNKRSRLRRGGSDVDCGPFGSNTIAIQADVSADRLICTNGLQTRRMRPLKVLSSRAAGPGNAANLQIRSWFTHTHTQGNGPALGNARAAKPWGFLLPTIGAVGDSRKQGFDSGLNGSFQAVQVSC
jgi:hypothetical protein